MKKSLIALAFGTLALGIAEFTMMGILPYVASDFGISIAKAGHFISAYACLLWSSGFNLSSEKTTQTDFDGLGDADYRRKSVCFAGS